ncbi:MAG: tetratricopeptide repeat protein [Bdellovibrionaceae bacterium]|nr:tetratricopeptide repeat protein [Pseudobdellovibrionaceae bacterium]
MSELETGHKIRFPIKERIKSSEETKNSCYVVNKDVRQQKLKEFDNETPEIVESYILELFNKANQAYKQGLDSLAHKLYLQIAASGSYNSEILFVTYKNLGNILVRSADLDGAEEFYNKAYTLNPDSDVLLVNLGTLEMQKPNLEKALERYRMAVDVNSSNPRAWIGLALVHREFGDLELSWGNLEKSLDIDPCDETAIELMVEWGVKESKFEALIKRLEAFLLINSKNSSIAETYARVLIVGGRLEKARFFIQNYIKTEGENPVMEKIMAVLQSSMSKTESALA